MLIRTKFDGYSADGLRRLHKGGGGGSAKYDNLEDLYKVQADSAKMLYDQANQYLPGATKSYMDKVNETLGDGYVEDQANKATADAASSSARQQEATSRNLASLGVNPSDPRFSSSLRATGVDSAAKSAAMTNVARSQAKAQQKATAQDAVGTFTGQSNSASQQLSGATSGMSNMFNSQAQQKAQQNAADSEAIGNTVGAGISLMSMMKDGGRVRCARGIKSLRNGGQARSIERHFLGGQTGGAQRGFLNASPQNPQAQFSQRAPSQGFGGGVVRGAQMANTIGNVGKGVAAKYQAASAGADMTAAQTKAASDAYTAAAQAAKTPAEAAKYKDAATWMERGNKAFGSEPAAGGAGEAAGSGQAAGAASADTAGGAAGAGATEAAGTTAATGATEAAGSTAATGAAEAAGTTAATGAAEAAAGTAAAEGAAAGAAGAAGASGLGAAGAALGAAMPWVGAALVAGQLLGVFADGGRVSDFREEGGEVSGPGSHTDDLVPALLSDDEHVMNGEAAAMVGHDKLEALNKQGLALRKKGYTLGQIKAGAGIKRRAA